jgi:hypothetical protein
MRYNKGLSDKKKQVFTMNQKKKENWRKHSFKPPMDEASDDSHLEHIKKLREEQKS